MLQDSYDDVIGDVGWSIAVEYLCRVAGLEWPNPEPEIVYEGGSPRVKKPQGVNKLVNRILDDIAKGKTLKDGSAVDPRDRWKKLSDAAKAPVIAAMGDMREPDLDDVPIARAERYALRDADCQFRITRPLQDRVRAMGLEEVAKVDHDILPMVDRMMSVGAYMAPVGFWDRLGAACDKQKAAAKYEIYKLTGRDLNPASGDQVADLLYGPVSEGGMGLTPLIMTDGGSTGKRRGSTNDKCLEDLLSQAPVVEHIQAYREADKLQGTYVEPLRAASLTPDRRAHTTFKVTRQVTGRITTAEPINLLSIPVRSELGAQCRYGFEAPPGKVMYDADMTQIELCLFAHESQDKNLLKAFREGIDLHTMTGSGMFGVPINQVEKHQRQAGKIVNFAIINMITAPGLLNQMILFRATRKDGTRWTEDDCARMLEGWFGMYPGGKACQQRFIEEARATGLARESISGRIRYLPNIWSPVRHIREAAERDAQFPIQAGAAAIMKKSAAVMWRALKPLQTSGVEPTLLVHDESLWECPDREYERGEVSRIVKGAFENTVKLSVPIRAEGKFGMSWGEAH
jgi:DNA polymerase-1